MKITTIGLDIAPTVGALGEISFSFICNERDGTVCKKEATQTKAGFINDGEHRTLSNRNGSLWWRELLGKRIYRTGAPSQTHRPPIG